MRSLESEKHSQIGSGKIAGCSFRYEKEAQAALVLMEKRGRGFSNEQLREDTEVPGDGMEEEIEPQEQNKLDTLQCDLKHLRGGQCYVCGATICRHEALMSFTIRIYGLTHFHNTTLFAEQSIA
jgi:hypothetical protein